MLKQTIHALKTKISDTITISVTDIKEYFFGDIHNPVIVKADPPIIQPAIFGTNKEV